MPTTGASSGTLADGPTRARSPQRGSSTQALTRGSAVFRVIPQRRSRIRANQIQAGVGLKRRAHQLQHHRRRRAPPYSIAAATSRLFPIPASPRNATPGVVNVPDWARAQLFCSRASSRSRPTNGPRVARDVSARSSAHPEVVDQLFHALHRRLKDRTSTSNAFRISGYDRIGDHHRIRRRQARHPCGQIRRPTRTRHLERCPDTPVHGARPRGR